MRSFSLFILGIAASASLSLFGQSQINYTGKDITGQIVRVGTVNLLLKAQTQTVQALGFAAAGPSSKSAGPSSKEEKPTMPPRLHPPVSTPFMLSAAIAATMPSLNVAPATGILGFNGLSHYDQRQANNGNQLSIEPPSPSIAVANGFVLQGVNNAVQVYTASGSPLLPRVVTTNELFGLAPNINRTTNVRGPFLTDMRVFYDQGVNRWFILQRGLDNNAAGTGLNTSHLYLAVSQTGDPTGVYTLYLMDTTNAQNSGCPCLADYPQVGSDQYGFYISANEFDTRFNQFVDAQILAISKASLAAGANAPGAVRFLMRRLTNFEFAIQPATTPPGGSFFVGNNGVEYFVSSNGYSSIDNRLAIWAMSNTASLDTASPNPSLAQILTPTLTYSSQDVATQRPGPLPYGSTLIPSGVLAFLDGGDTRVLSVSYAGGRLFVSLGTQVVDENNKRLSGGAYMILSPTLRSGVLGTSALRQGYLLVKGNHLLRPAIAVNPQGKGAIAFTLVGPDYYPSGAFVPIDTLSTGSTVQVSAPGVLPEDGFTGYPDNGFQLAGVARWGDYSGAVATSDGSIWMTTQYIPNGPRTELANWGTFLTRYAP